MKSFSSPANGKKGDVVSKEPQSPSPDNRPLPSPKADDKKPWQKPSATVEQVSKATKNSIAGGGADQITCHT
jgi:hypothetical protein